MLFRVFALYGSALSLLCAEPGLVVSYDMLPRLVRSQNPDLAAARLRIAEAVGRAAKAGLPDNPAIETALEQDSRFREWKAEIGFSQRFPVTGRLRLERGIGLTEIKAAEAEVRDVERQLTASARGAMVEILALRQRRQLLESQRTLAGEFAESLGKTAAKGEASLLDAGQARIEAASLDAALRQIDAQEAAETGRLKSLLGTPAGRPLGVSGVLPPPQHPGRDIDPGRRPDLQAKLLEAASAADGVKLQQARKYDDLEAGVFVGNERKEDGIEGYQRDVLVGLRLRIPLPLWNNNAGAVNEARAKQERARREAGALEQHILIEAETAREEMARWAKLVTEIETTLLPLADAQATDAEKAFRSGQSDIQTVFRSREKRFELAATRLESLRQFHLARVRLDAAAGIP